MSPKLPTSENKTGQSCRALARLFSLEEASEPDRGAHKMSIDGICLNSPTCGAKGDNTADTIIELMCKMLV